MTFIGGVSTDHSGFGVGRILDVEVDRRAASSRCTKTASMPLIPGYDVNSYAAAAPPSGGHPMTTTDLPIGPVIDTSTAPAGGARQVEAQKPDLLLTQEHHMCPGCGEPIAVRQFLETITQLDAVDRAIAVAGIGCYTSFSGTMDVDLVQALHGRAPSVATGVKRMLPDALVFTLQGDGDMVNEGLQEVIHTAARGETVTCILLNNGVFGETGGHMTATTRDRPAHQELDRRPRRRVPRLPDPDRRPHRAAPGRGVRRARLGAQRGLGRPHAEDVQAGVRVAARAARASRSSRC